MNTPLSNRIVLFLLAAAVIALVAAADRRGHTGAESEYVRRAVELDVSSAPD